MDILEEVSDDEVFFGKFTLKEVKLRVLKDIYRQKNFPLAPKGNEVYKEDNLKIIEMSSEPNLFLQKDADLSPSEQLKSTSDPNFSRKHNNNIIQLEKATELENEDSFLEVEKVIMQHSMPSNESNNLDNTLDYVNFILNQASPNMNKKEQSRRNDIKVCDNDDNYFNHDIKVPKDEILSQCAFNEEVQEVLAKKEIMDIKPKLNILPDTPIKHVSDISLTKNIKIEATSVVNTPMTKQNDQQNLFKTPRLQSCKKDTGLLKTPNKSKLYEHIASPIATYIKNTPQSLLVKNVKPKKPLPCVSSIPRLMKNKCENKMSNKENLELPQLAYRSAKTTIVMDVSKDKLPQSDKLKKLTSSIQKPDVLRHVHREASKEPLMSYEDSFANLSLHQANVSVCTKKIAYNNK